MVQGQCEYKGIGRVICSELTFYYRQNQPSKLVHTTETDNVWQLPFQYQYVTN